MFKNSASFFAVFRTYFPRVPLRCTGIAAGADVRGVVVEAPSVPVSVPLGVAFGLAFRYCSRIRAASGERAGFFLFGIVEILRSGWDGHYTLIIAYRWRTYKFPG
jgi:hypothetical protein